MTIRNVSGVLDASSKTGSTTVLVAAVLNLAVLWPALAQDQQSGCFPGGAVKRAEAVSALIADPAVLLTRNPNGGARLSAEVRDYVGSDLKTLDAVLGLMKVANAEQVSAIGAGLGQVATLCARTNTDAGLRLQQSVAATTVQPLIAALVAGSNPIDTAAIAPAASQAAGGPPGGPVTVNTATPRTVSVPQGSTESGFSNPRTNFTFNSPSRVGGSTVTTLQTVSP